MGGMASEREGAETFRLEPLDDRGAAEVGAPSVSGAGPVVLGRGHGCEICFQDPSVSRRHASLVKRDARWFVVDHGGQHGTYLNGVRLEPEEPALAAQGDFLRVGPYTFRIVFDDSRATTIARTERQLDSDTIVERVSNRERGSLAQRRLEVLIDGAVAINQATDETALGEAIVEVAMAGTGFPRAAVIRPAGSSDAVEVLVARDAKVAGTGQFSFSSSLLREAAGGHLARLSRRGGEDLGQSIERLGITAALCAPIILDASVVAYIYVDARADEQAGYPDAAGFCHAISKMAGLALSNLKRAELQLRQRRLEEDLRGARQAQAFLCPKGEGRVGALTYAMQTVPGRFVAGDLFDIFPIDEDRAGICFGDVTGQGATAAILMAAVLSHMRASLARYGDPADAIRDVNRYIAECSPAHMFVSLWVGVYDHADRSLRYVDGGHGHWFITYRDKGPVHAGKPGGLLVGIDADYAYESATLDLAGVDRIILYSDGVIEQVDPSGVAFGHDRVKEILAGTTSAKDDVTALFKELEAFAGKKLLDDDTTVASIEIETGIR